MKKSEGTSADADRAGRASPRAGARLGHSATIASAVATYSEMLPVPELTRKQIIRFEKNVEEDANGCWHWTGYRNHGRPYFKIGGRGYFAQRVMFAEAFGRHNLDKAMVIRRCGVSDCVNPDHMVLGGEQSLADARKDYGGYTPWDGKRSGIANPNARFSDNEIVAMYEATGSLAEIGKRFGASPGYVWRIKAGRTRAQAIEARQGHDPQGRGAKHESAVPERDAPK